MQPLPIFFETLEGPKTETLQIVRLVRQNLFQQGIRPLPFARSLAELQSVIETVKAGDGRPAIFVLNLFGAEKLLADLDRLMGDAPALFFRRELLWLRGHAGQMDGEIGVTTQIGQMQPRLAVIRTFGPRDSGKVARRLAGRLERFLRFGDFRSLEENLDLDRILPRHASKAV